MRFTQAFGKITFLAFLLMGLTIMSCSDDKDEPDPVIDTNPIVATWQLTSITPETAGTTIPNLTFIETAVPCLYSLKLTFNADNTLSTADCPTAVTAIETLVPVTGATWKVDGTNLVLTKDGKSQSFKFTQTSTDLKITAAVPATATTAAVNAVLNFKKV